MITIPWSKNRPSARTPGLSVDCGDIVVRATIKGMYIKALILTMIAFFITSTNAEMAIEPHAFCQAKLLKAATDGLVTEFMDKAKYVGVIDEITFNYNLPGRPRVILISRNAKEMDQVCIVDVETRAPAENGSVCPDYQFHSVRSTCE